jgi:ketosteroid isomerase-like protein
MKVRVLNAESALVTGIWSGAGTDAKGQKFEQTQRYMDVFVKRGSTWRCVASQNTAIPK